MECRSKDKQDHHVVDASIRKGGDSKRSKTDRYRLKETSKRDYTETLITKRVQQSGLIMIDTKEINGYVKRETTI